MSIQSVNARLAEISNIRKNISLKYDGLFDQIYSEKIAAVEEKTSATASSAGDAADTTSTGSVTGTSASTTGSIDTSSQDQMADLLTMSMLSSSSGLMSDGTGSSSSGGVSDILSVMMMSKLMEGDSLFGSSGSDSDDSGASGGHVHCPECGEVIDGSQTQTDYSNAQTVVGQDAVAGQFDQVYDSSAVLNSSDGSVAAVGSTSSGGSVAAGVTTASFTGAYKAGEPTGDFSGAAQYMDLINQASVKYDIPVDIIQAVMYTESSFNNSTVSSAGAQGLMQLMPGTAEYLGVSDPFDPAQNIDGGVRYLREMLDTFGNDIRVALAAYNTGPGNVRKCGGDENYYNISSGVQGYVSKVLGLAGYAIS